MNIIQEDYVSFEVAELLKEKGFNEQTVKCYNLKHELCKCQCNPGEAINSTPNYLIAAPTLQMVCKWLREVHNIFIDIYLPSHSEHEDTIYHGTYSFDIFNLNTKGYVYCSWNEMEFNSYEEAIEAAIKYTLENLI